MYETESAFIFINEEQAVGFGHIGWGFHVGGEQYCFGSTDHLWRTRYSYWHLPELIRYMDVAPKANNDFWSHTGNFREMMTDMRVGRHVRYHQFKVVPVENPDPQGAIALAHSLKDEGWNVLLNNCVHQTYQVLTRYGAKLPDPYVLLNRFPKNWFGAISGDTIKLCPMAKPEHNSVRSLPMPGNLIQASDIDANRRAG
ncbi:MAG TPA: hypothetical protein V6C69_06400 [Trichormus sp.]|jgi:hypothetical protein